MAYSSSLVIYTSRRDDTTTEDSDAASLGLGTNESKNHATFPSSDYASLSDVQLASEDGRIFNGRTRRRIQEDLLYQPVKHPERIFKVGKALTNFKQIIVLIQILC